MGKTAFMTVGPGGKMTTIRTLEREDMLKCPFVIIMPEHYREDGSCKCDDEEHRKYMIKHWGYRKYKFKNIPLREVKPDAKG